MGGFRGILSTTDLIQDLRWNYVLVCLGGILFQVPLIVLGSRGDANDAAFLRLSLSLITAVSYIESGLWKMVNPLLSRRMFSEGSSSVIVVMRRWTLRAGLPLAVAVAIAAAFVPLVIPSFFGQGYGEMGSGLRWMLLGAAVSVFFFVLSPAYFAAGGVRPWVIGYSTYALVTVTVGISAGLRADFTGFATVFGCSTILFNLIMAFLAPRVLDPSGGLKQAEAAQPSPPSDAQRRDAEEI